MTYKIRGDWRRESTSAPSLLTKSCHDMDLLLWLLCCPPPKSSKPAYLPRKVTSSGSLLYFKKGHKPAEAENATNCLSCNYEPLCKYSSKKIYIEGKDPSLKSGNLEWPIEVLVPDIEDCVRTGGVEAGEKTLLEKLSEDYDEHTPTFEIHRKPWFGRCVYESDNDVCDTQTVTLTFDEKLSEHGTILSGGKLVTFNMVPLTKKVCERYTNISGTDGEVYANSSSIMVHNFSTGENKKYFPSVADGGHGAGDGGLARQFILAIDKVKNHGANVEEAQKEYIGCSIEEVVRSHALVFAAEEARESQTVVDFPSWWKANVEAKLT
jgi:hypothetical protein